MNMFAVGSYTHRVISGVPARGRGISIVEWDTDRQGSSAGFEVLGEYSDIRNPTYLSWDYRARLLYSISETKEGKGAAAAFEAAPDGSLEYLDATAGSGRPYCHITALSESHLLFAASYSGGGITGYSLDQGRPGEAVLDVLYSGRGPNPSRQESSHAHQVMKSPFGSVLYVCDLGTDTVWMHRLDALKEPPVPALRVPAGYGPRHLAFDPVAPASYLLCELVPKLLAVRIDTLTGLMTITGELDAAPDTAAGTAAPAAVKVHPSGRVVAVSNRFDDTVSAYLIRRGKGVDGRSPEVTLEQADRFPCGGLTPRDITFTPDGGALLIANQDSHTLTCRFFDPLTGLPQNRWGPVLETGSPVCVVMLD
jgi:6-phosphogluconolactonase